jgi:hypothetical protein
MRAILLLLTVAVALIGFSQAAGQELQIGIIDFYGLNRVTLAQAREALTFKEGDSISYPGVEPSPTVEESEIRLSKLPGVVRAHANTVCCDNGRVIVYVGIEERGAPTMRLRAEPAGKARLADDVVAAGEEFSKAFMLAMERGHTGEDRSQGHSLVADAATRAIQERFLIYAKRDLAHLRLVLRSSSDATQRALAAQVLGYAADKQAVVNDLVYGMTDPSGNVRNNAMRTLLVFGEMVPVAKARVPRIPYEPFIAFLHSPVWTDRNKASGALMTLSESRDASLLARLRKDALVPLIEMARWKSDGHARSAFTILGRMAGYSDDAARAAWDRGERELVISAALRRQ